MLKLLLIGLILKQYGPAFRKYHQLTLNVLKEFGFGSTLMEQRIMTEAEELVSLIKKLHGKSFHPEKLFSSGTLNVIASIIFGERLSQTDKNLNEYARLTHLFITSKIRYIDYFPLLRFVPHFKKVLQEAYGYRRAQLKFIEEGIERSLASSDDSVT